MRFNDILPRSTIIITLMTQYIKLDTEKDAVESSQAVADMKNHKAKYRNFSSKKCQAKSLSTDVCISIMLSYSRKVQM